MLPACRTDGAGFAMPTFDVVPSDVEGFMEALWLFLPNPRKCKISSPALLAPPGAPGSSTLDRCSGPPGHQGPRLTLRG